MTTSLRHSFRAAAASLLSVAAALVVSPEAEASTCPTFTAIRGDAAIGFAQFSVQQVNLDLAELPAVTGASAQDAANKYNAILADMDRLAAYKLNTIDGTTSVPQLLDGSVWGVQDLFQQGHTYCFGRQPLTTKALGLLQTKPTDFVYSTTGSNYVPSSGLQGQIGHAQTILNLRLNNVRKAENASLSNHTFMLTAAEVVYSYAVTIDGLNQISAALYDDYYNIQSALASSSPLYRQQQAVAHNQMVAFIPVIVDQAILGQTGLNFAQVLQPKGHVPVVVTDAPGFIPQYAPVTDTVQGLGITTATDFATNASIMTVFNSNKGAFQTASNDITYILTACYELASIAGLSQDNCGSAFVTTDPYTLSPTKSNNVAGMQKSSVKLPQLAHH